MTDPDHERARNAWSTDDPPAPRVKQREVARLVYKKVLCVL